METINREAITNFSGTKLIQNATEIKNLINSGHGSAKRKTNLIIISAAIRAEIKRRSKAIRGRN